MKGYREAEDEFNEAVERDRSGIFAVLTKNKLKQPGSGSNELPIARSSLHNSL